MHYNTAEMWLNTMYGSALIFSRYKKNGCLNFERFFLYSWLSSTVLNGLKEKSDCQKLAKGSNDETGGSVFGYQHSIGAQFLVLSCM